MEADMQEPGTGRKFGRFVYDAATGNILVAAMVAIAVVLGFWHLDSSCR